MNDLAKTVRLPRPNPGPEPAEAPSSPWLPIAILIIILAAVLGLGYATRARRRKRSARVATRGSDPVAVSDDPRERWAAWSLAVREALAERFGPAWRAKTTEEIAAEPQLREVLEADRAGELLEHLAEADRVKFADAGYRLAEPDFAMLAALAGPAGASSTIKGR